MKVIFADYSKTGTKSMTSAFNTLGYRSYDYMEHFWYHKDKWSKIWKHGSTVEEFKEMYKDVDAISGAPVYFFWEKILGAFPNAKVILVDRNEYQWFESITNQWRQSKKYLLKASFTPTGLNFFIYGRHIRRMFGIHQIFPWNVIETFSRDILQKLYKEHNLYVRMKCPKECLLVFKIEEGWKPLCEFLGKKIPDQKFPHKNKSGTLFEDLKMENPVLMKIEREFKIVVVIVVILVACLFYCYLI